MRIHIFGASGCGTTTLGKTLGDVMEIDHLDTDDFYWKRTDVPFSQKQSPEKRIADIRTATRGLDRWILSGSMCSWGDPLIPEFTHMIYLSADWDTRYERLLIREAERYGLEALSPGGEMYKIHNEFIQWASRYDSAGLEQRSRNTHEAWISALPPDINVLRIDGQLSKDEVFDIAWAQLTSNSRGR